MKNILMIILFFAPVLLVAQQTYRDTLSSDASHKKKIRILNSDNSVLIESDSGDISRFRGNVKMEHEGVIMECDTAVSWPNGIFEAFGNTKVTSGTTVIKGDMMIYNEITYKAKVTGKIVYLIDSSSILRTTEIDFDTKTEIGYFEYGGTIADSFRTLESQKGYYYSKNKEFEFIGQVQSDTKDYVLQSDSMKYNTETKIFVFYSNTHIWSENNYMYCDKGWYDSDKDIIFFHSNSYMLFPKQEIFADSIYYENNNKKGRLYSNIQVADTAQKTIALADFADFDMNSEDFLMCKNPSNILYDNQDSVFIRADTICSVTKTVKIPVPKKDLVSSTPDSVPDSILPDMGQHVSDTILPDIIGQDVSDTILPDIGQLASDTILPDIIGQDVSDTILPAIGQDVSDTILPAIGQLASDTILPAIGQLASDTILPAMRQLVSNTFLPNMRQLTSDTLSPNMGQHASDTLLPDMGQHASDTIEYMDSTYKELFAYRNVKLYRFDFQLKSDSMYFNNVDSIWQIYYDPILWDGKKMQIISDSMKFHIKDGELQYTDFNGNAMVIIPEGDPDTTVCFNQVKSKNMRAYLKNRQLTLFEAMGNVQTIAFSLNNFTMNKAESSSFKIFFESGKARTISYYDQVTGDNNPLYSVREDEIQLPGFRWEIELRPKSGNEVLNRSLRLSERTVRESLPKPSFPITKKIEEIELKLRSYNEQNNY
jgi:lipopolysaccharide export system protein LptA